MPRRLVPALLAFALAGACAEESAEPRDRPEVAAVEAVGDSEGELNLVVLPGYAEDGSTDPEYDWVHPFERATGCDVRVRYADSGGEVVRQLTGGGDQLYDGASVPGDVAGLLIRAGVVSPVDPALFRHADELLEPLQGANASHASDGDRVFGTPALYGPNLLVYDTRLVEDEPSSWSAVLEPDPAVGPVAMLDSPMALADAARYLSVHRPELAITDPYALTPTQLDAATELLAAQAPDVGLYWTSFTDVVDAFRAGDVVAGQGWPIALSLLGEERFDASVPTEGLTGWADTWMLTSDAPHPNCMLRWMRWTMQAAVQAEMALWYGAAPSNGKACRLIRTRLGSFADLADSLAFGRCGDEAFLSSLALWRTPAVACGDDRGRSCTGYPAWLARWATVRQRA